MSIRNFEIVNQEGQLLLGELERMAASIEGIYRSVANGQAASLQTSAGVLTVSGNQFQYRFFKITGQPAAADDSYEFEEVIDENGEYIDVEDGVTDDAIGLYEINESITVPDDVIVRAWLAEDGSRWWFDARGEHTYMTLDVLIGACPVLDDITLDDITPTGTLSGMTIRGGTWT